MGLRGGGVGVFGGDGGGGLECTHIQIICCTTKVTDVGGFFGGAFGAINFSIFGGVLTYKPNSDIPQTTLNIPHPRWRRRR